MADVKLVKPTIKIYFKTAPGRWFCEVDSIHYTSDPNFNSLLKKLVAHTVISESDAYQLQKEFNNKRPIIL